MSSVYGSGSAAQASRPSMFASNYMRTAGASRHAPFNLGDVFISCETNSTICTYCIVYPNETIGSFRRIRLLQSELAEQHGFAIGWLGVQPFCSRANWQARFFHAGKSTKRWAVKDERPKSLRYFLPTIFLPQKTLSNGCEVNPFVSNVGPLNRLERSVLQQPPRMHFESVKSAREISNFECNVRCNHTHLLVMQVPIATHDR